MCHRPRIVPALLSAIVLLTGLPLAASVVAPLPFDRLIGSADVVFTGTVVRVEPFWERTSAGPAIVTRVTFRVDRGHKGRMNREINLEFLGGRIGDRELVVSGMPRFEIGQEDVICARTRGPEVSPIVGLNQGRFRVNRDSAGRRFVTTHEGDAIASVAQIGQPRLLVAPVPTATMPLEQFELEIARIQRAAAR
jgi:hypothetical protein